MDYTGAFSLRQMLKQEDKMRMLRTPTLVVCLVAAPLLLVQGAIAQSNPRIGTWTLNLAKSKYDPGPAPKSDTRTYTESSDSMITMKAEVVTADGTKESSGYTAKYDGKEYPFTGATGDHIKIKPAGGNTTDATLSKDGRVVQTTHSVISNDGKTMTLTSKGTGAQGRPYTNVRVFEKQ